MAAKLKVFVTSDGFTEYVVAATSRPKALAAWGAHQDLFKTGGAREVDDPELVAAATARPGEVLRRPTGAEAPPRPALKPKPKPPAPPKGPSKAALRKVETLERRLAELDAAHRAELQAIAEARDELDRRLASAERSFESDRRKLEEAVRAAKAEL